MPTMFKHQFYHLTTTIINHQPWLKPRSFISHYQLHVFASQFTINIQPSSFNRYWPSLLTHSYSSFNHPLTIIQFPPFNHHHATTIIQPPPFNHHHSTTILTILTVLTTHPTHHANSGPPLGLPNICQASRSRRGAAVGVGQHTTCSGATKDGWVAGGALKMVEDGKEMMVNMVADDGWWLEVSSNDGWWWFSLMLNSWLIVAKNEADTGE